MKKYYILILLVCLIQQNVNAQIGRDFWFAAPDVSDSHDGTRLNQYFRFAAFGNDANVRIYQPNNPTTGLDSSFTVTANSLFSIQTLAFQNEIESGPWDQVLNTGIKIEADTDITVYYEVATPNNPDIFALKANNALGNEFYIPFQNIWNNQPITDQGYAQFNIIATEDNTTIWIFPSQDLFNHSAGIPYSITLNSGEVYTGRSLSTSGALKPSGTVISSDKPIAVTYSDDSVRPQPTGSFGCFDIYGDQLVPTNVIGQEYILNSNGNNFGPEELAVIVATENFTTIDRNGAFETVLFAGQTYIDTISDAESSVYYAADKPIYVIQITGFGCEMGSAILPPLNCAGSDQVSFARSPDPCGGCNLDFFLSILVRTGAEGDFELDGDPTLIQAADFTVVPGTGGEWMAMFQSYSEAEIAEGAAHQVTNSSDVFSLGVVNGNVTGGTRFGYFSLFQSDIFITAGNDITTCSGNDVTLSGTVSGAVNTGLWTTVNGTGTFDDDTDLGTTYRPSVSDYALGSITMVLESTGKCFAEYDTMTINFTPAPTIDVGNAQTLCENNADVTLAATITVAAGIQWTAGSGSFSPNNTSLNATYTPTSSEINSGSMQIYATTTGMGDCAAVSDTFDITFVDAPIVDAGGPYSSCANDADINLSGSIVTYQGFGQGIWSNTTGAYTPGATALGAIYSPSAAEISAGIVTIRLESTNNGICNAEFDTANITIAEAPVVSAGSDQSLCANNPEVSLNGSFSNATGVIWSGGAGTFNPDNTTPNATYTPTAGEITNGTVVLTLTTTGNGLCMEETSDVTITFTPAPTAEAGPNQTVCANNSAVSLNGSVTVALNGSWSGGNGSYSPGNNFLSTTYSPSATEITNGTVRLYLTSTDNGNCLEVVDSIDITIESAPVVNIGGPYTSCANNPDVALSATVITSSGFGTGDWTTGAGTYTPGRSALNAVYTPTVTEVNNGVVTLTLVSTNNGTCNAVSDITTLTIIDAPTASAGSDQILCSNNPDAQLNGNASNYDSIVWTGGLGSFSPDPHTLNAVYTPTQSELLLGSVNLTLTVIGQSASCSNATDDMRISFTAAPTVDAGPNQTVCENNEEVTLNGSFTIAGGVEWTNWNGTWVTGDEFTVNSTYRPSAGEISSGQVILYLNTINNGNCVAVSDSIIVTIDPAPTVNAGLDDTSCVNNATITLAATFSGAGGISWTGNGTFIPNIFDPNATYTPTTAEIAAGIASIDITTTANGNCNAVNDNLILTIEPAPSINAGNDQTLCANNASASLTATQTGASGVSWSGGLGLFGTPNLASTTYEPAQNEINSGFVDLIATTTGNGNCSAVSDTIRLNFTAAPTVDAGLPLTVCGNNADATLSATSTIAAGIQWSGNGVFSPNVTSPNIIYTPSSAEITNGTATVYIQTTGNGNCTVVTDSVIITITSAPTVEAGTNLASCENNPSVTLSGSFTGAGGIQWSNGSGTFIPSIFDPNAEYVPSSGEISTGVVNLILTTTGNGLCNAVSDIVQVNINPAPTANAGNDQVLCGNNADVSLNGAITLASGAIWSGGLGTFTPNNTSLITTYTPTAQEITNGSVTLTLTTTGNDNCLPVSDDVIITFTDAPLVNAGLDQSVCTNNPNVTLEGGVTVATGAEWLGGTGSFTPNNTTLNAIYTPTAAEISTGSLTLTLRSTGNGQCTAVEDSMIIIFTPEPFVEAGPDQTVCVDELDVALSGFISGATSTGQWSSSGNGLFIPTINDLNATYRVSSNDSLLGSVTMTLTSTNNGNCLAEQDFMTITITTAGVASAGVDQTVCANDATIQLNGGVTGGALSGTWISSGDGVFVPNNSTLNATYIPGSQDIANGGANFTLTANSCNLAQDNMVLVITPAPVVDAGTDQLVCVDDLTIALDGQVSGATTTGLWSIINGSGNFSPNTSTLDADYIASSTDSINGSITLLLEATSIGNCLPVSDTLIINILPGGVVSAGNDQTVCANDAAVQLSGTIGGGALSASWSSSGDGTFNPDANDLNAIYTPGNNDMNNGAVTLTIVANSCDQVSDQMDITITPAPTVDAGSDVTVCQNNADTTLNGSVTVATGGIWSTNGNGSFSPSNTILNPTYIPAATDTLITIYLTSFGNGDCLAETDSFQLSMIEAPLVDAGLDIDICAGTTRVPISGDVSNGTTTGVWTTSGTGGFDPSGVVLDNDYIMSAQDSINLGVTLTLTSTNNGLCNAVSDDLIITITESGTVDAGVDQSICANNATAVLNGNFTGNISQTTWTTSGDGSFVPSINDLTATYTPGTADSLAGNVTITLSGNSCNAPTDDLLITITTAPFVEAGPDQINCVTDLDFALDGIVAGASNSGLWTTSGTGSFIPSADVLNATYLASANDSISGEVTLTLTTTNVGNCIALSDNLRARITTGGAASAGNDQVVCSNNADVQLNGSFSGGATQGTWSTSGNGSFTPDITNPFAQYIPSTFDLATGNVTLTYTANSCDLASDDMEVTFTPAPSIEAGDNQIICANNADVPLSATVNVSSGVLWSASGGGFFSPSNTSLNATYTPTQSEIDAGSTSLFIVSTGNGDCLEVSDSLIVNFSGAPVVDAGEDQSICKGITSTVLQGLITVGAATGSWSTSGSGSFIPNDSVLFNQYLFSPADTANGFVDIFLTSTNNGNCIPVTDTMRITFEDQGQADAGPDLSACENNLLVTIDATISGGATQVTWLTSGDGTFSPDANTVDVSYIPGPQDESNGFVALTMNTNSCNSASDVMNISITPSPVVDAGPDQVNCVNDLTFDLDGQVLGASNSGIWTSTGTGTFIPNANTLDATYQASASDSIEGNIQLILTATNIGNCSAVSDTINVRITTGGSANAGNDQVVCDNNSAIQLNGLFSGGANLAVWSTSGTGSFTPDNTTMNAIYHPSAFDLASGNVLITLTANSCDLASDDMLATFTDAPSVDAGENTSVCYNNPNVQLAATVNLATGVNWTSNGSGSFSPGSLDPNATYIPGQEELDNGTFTLYVTSTGNGSCLAVSDSIIIDVTPAPEVTAGEDFNQCEDDSIITLQGLVLGGSITGEWSTAGTGVFLQSPSSLFNNYQVSSQDTTNPDITFVLTSTNNGNCLAATDTIVVTFSPLGAADAGLDQTICATDTLLNLNGSLSGGATQASWSTSGDGYFLPSADIEDPDYVLGATDITNGTVTLTLNTNSCNSASDDVIMTITAAPVVDAGADQVNCTNDLTFDLNGVISGASTTGEWTTLGSGSFSPSNSDLNAIYTASAADSAAGDFFLVLTATNIGSCGIITDTIDLRITTAGSADAGNDQVICGNNPSVQLNGSFTGGANEGTWSTSGTGSFSPSINDLNAAYEPSSFDLSLGSVDITLTVNSCDLASDVMTITFTDGPVAEAGENVAVCENNALVGLSGSVQIATGGNWTSSGTGSFNPSNTDLNTSYVPSEDDIANGGVTIYLETTGNGNCLSSTDSMFVTFTPKPDVDAGLDQSICLSTSTVNLQGIVTGGSSSGQWTSLGDGIFFPNDETLLGAYIVGTADTTSGSVTLILTSTSNGNCFAEDDTMQVSFGDNIFVNAGDDEELCANNLSTQLNGFISGGSNEGIWSTSVGSGTFTPDVNTLDASYQFSSADSLVGFVSLILTSTNNGGCLPGRDTLTLSIAPIHEVNAGPDRTLCPEAIGVDLSPTITNATAINWTSLGTGTFTPNDQTLNATYTFTDQDRSNGSVNLVLTSSGNSACYEVYDTINISLSNPLVANFVFNGTCFGDVVQFTDSSVVLDGEIATYTWDFGDGANSNSQNPEHSYGIINTYDVSLKIEGTLGCSDSITKSVTIDPIPQAGFSHNSTSYVINNTINFIDESSSASSYLYIFGTGLDSTDEANPQYIYTESGSYIVSQYVTNEAGCSDSTTLDIVIGEDEIYPPLLPSAFTPNGDNNNDILTIKGGPFSSVDFRVYNEWGELIFRTEDPDVGWDGSHDGKEQPNGTYLYTVTAVTIDNKEYKITGDITIIR